MPTLYEYYKSQGKSLPSVTERRPLAEKAGITGYTGTAEQNAKLLSSLQGDGAGTMPTNIGDEAPAGPLPPLPGTPAPGGSLGNLRRALRMAAEEAGKERVAGRLEQFQGAGLGKTPGTLGSIADIVRGSVRLDVKSVFGDVIKGIEAENTAKQKEFDRINELRVEYGSLVPSNITDLETALDLIAPTVDKERKLRLDKMATDQAADNDIESWAESFAKGEVAIGNVPAKIRTQVKVRADVIKAKLETEAKEEYKNRITFRLEKKTSDFETERTLATQDDNLSVAEQREIIDYIDTLEQQQKASKQTKRGAFEFMKESPSTVIGNLPQAPNPVEAFAEYLDRPVRQ